MFFGFGQTISRQRETVGQKTDCQNRGLTDLEYFNWGRRTKSLD